ncbi:helix-turn-helix domain-containing protein [Streptococcus pneumoniae]|nr:helix-turn-helix transcriptional regulator [Streptococcus pneumoniae]CMZ69195.1 repressor [Streptococcus pneumoniae]
MIYDKIKEIASEKGISIYRIEKDLDLGNGAISKWNNSSPSATTLNSIANYLNVRLEQLLEEYYERTHQRNPE